MAHYYKKLQDNYNHSLLRIYDLVRWGMGRELELKKLVIALCENRQLTEKQNELLEEIRHDLN